MSKKLYVGNLPFSVDEAKLKSLFVAFGEVSEALVVINKFSGRSKGFGFVTMDDAGAEKAKAELNGKEVEGRKLFVNDATPFDPSKPRPERRGGFGGGRGGYGGERRGGFGGNRGGGRRFGDRNGGFKRRDDSEGGEESVGDAQFGSDEE
jgi:RNA recognition motif-containing protein